MAFGNLCAKVRRFTLNNPTTKYIYLYLHVNCPIAAKFSEIIWAMIIIMFTKLKLSWIKIKNTFQESFTSGFY